MPKPIAHVQRIPSSASTRPPAQPKEAADLATLRLLIYGFSGSGKSHLLTDVVNTPELLPMHLLSVDGGAETLRRRLRGVPGVVLSEVVSPAEIETALKEGLNDPAVKTIAIDGLRNIYDTVLNAINPVMPEGMLLPRSITDWSDNSQRDRGIVLQVVTQLMDTIIRKTNKHFIATCLAEEAVDGEGKPTGQLSIAMAGRLKRVVPSFFSMTGYLGVERIKRPPAAGSGGGVQTVTTRVLVLVPTAKYPEAKTRYADASSPAARDIAEPTMAKILDQSIHLYKKQES
jgi:hypothetical protein